MSPDIVSGTLCAILGLGLFHQCWCLYKTKDASSFSATNIATATACAAAAMWLAWSVGARFATFGNALIVLADALWLAMTLWYRFRVRWQARRDRNEDVYVFGYLARKHLQVDKD